MPWQHQMVLPYLIPRELPESELQQLALFTRGFVQRNGHDLTDTMLNMTRTLGGGILPLAGVERPRSDERGPDGPGSHPGGGGVQLPRRHADFRDDLAELTGRPLP